MRYSSFSSLWFDILFSTATVDGVVKTEPPKQEPPKQEAPIKAHTSKTTKTTVTKTSTSVLSVTLLSDLQELRRKLEQAESGLTYHLHMPLGDNSMHECSQHIKKLQVCSCFSKIMSLCIDPYQNFGMETYKNTFIKYTNTVIQCPDCAPRFGLYPR